LVARAGIRFFFFFQSYAILQFTKFTNKFSLPGGEGTKGESVRLHDSSAREERHEVGVSFGLRVHDRQNAFIRTRVRIRSGLEKRDYDAFMT
jgi:hypothetical protein